MNDDFSVFPKGRFPVYNLSSDRIHKPGDLRGHESVCQQLCAVYWPPVLTSGRPEAGPGVDQHALGIIVRRDGTHQVTYHDQPLYLYTGDAYIPGITGAQSINGTGAATPWGAFNTISPMP